MNLWELACLRCLQLGLSQYPGRCHREQARSHSGSGQHLALRVPMNLWELACLRCLQPGRSE